MAAGGAWLIKPNRFIILVSTAEQTLQSAVMLARHRLYTGHNTFGEHCYCEISEEEQCPLSSVEDDATQTLIWRRHDTATLQSCSSHAVMQNVT